LSGELKKFLVAVVVVLVVQFPVIDNRGLERPDHVEQLGLGVSFERLVSLLLVFLSVSNNFLAFFI